MKNKNQRTYKDNTDEILSMKKKSFCKKLFTDGILSLKKEKKRFFKILNNLKNNYNQKLNCISFFIFKKLSAYI